MCQYFCKAHFLSVLIDEGVQFGPDRNGFDIRHVSENEKMNKTKCSYGQYCLAEYWIMPR